MTRAFCETSPVGAAAALAAQIAANVPDLVTERLRLRAPEVSDFDTYANILDGPRGRHILDQPASRADIWLDFCSMIATWMLRGHGLWSVTSRADDSVLGFVLVGAEPGDVCHELGFLVTPAAEGRSIAYEAAAAARDWAWSELRVPALVSYVAPGNARSAALAVRLGAERGPDHDPETHVYHYPRPEARQ